jgi:hypothetical protein
VTGPFLYYAINEENIKTSFENVLIDVLVGETAKYFYFLHVVWHAIGM